MRGGRSPRNGSPPRRQRRGRHPTHARTSQPSTEGETPPSLSYRFSPLSRPSKNAERHGHVDSEPGERKTHAAAAKQQTGGSAPGSGIRRHPLRNGQLWWPTWSVPGAPRGWGAKHAYTPVGKGMQHGKPTDPSPARGGRPSGQAETRRSSRAPRRVTGTPRTTARSAWG